LHFVNQRQQAPTELRLNTLIGMHRRQCRRWRPSDRTSIRR
jgi:hypothetical protein